MLETLSDRFNTAFRSLSGRGRISEANVRESMQEVRTALLEADVHYDVVKEFCDEVVQDALGEKVLESLKPGQQMIEIGGAGGSDDEHGVTSSPDAGTSV